MEAQAGESWRAALEPYVALLGQFVVGDIDADQIETRYLKMYLGDETAWPDAPFHVLDEFFSDVDSYTADERLRTDEEDIDGDELRRRAAVTLGSLRRLLSS